MKTFFQEITMAVTDFKFYKRVKDFQMSKGIKYIFSLIFLITLILTIRYSYDVKKGLNLAVDWANQNLPVIEIQNGIVKTDVIQPYRISEEDFTLIIDTTGGVTSLDEYETGILLTKNKLFYKANTGKTEIYDLSGVESLRIDENFMNTLKGNITWILFPFMLLGIFIYSSIARFIQVFLFSLISLGASSASGIKLNYKQLFNIGVYAITPSMALGALLAFFAVRLPAFWLIYSGLYVIYLIMAILKCKEKSEEKGDVSPAPKPL